MSKSDRTVDFGFETVASAEKAGRVGAVFASVAGKYDLMNDLMSLGVHRLWKRFALSLTGLKPGQRALDVAGGTGDLAIGMLRQVGKDGRVVLSDINPRMLEIGRDRLLDAGLVGNVQCLIADAERLPFADDSFDCVTIGFGLRNVTDKAAALRSMYRVLKPAGQLLVLEFSTPVGSGSQTAVRRLFLQRIAPAGPAGRARRRKLSISGRIHPHAPESRDAARDAAQRRLCAGPLSQSDGRHRRSASRVQDLTCRLPPLGSHPSRRCSIAASTSRFRRRLPHAA